MSEYKLPDVLSTEEKLELARQLYNRDKKIDELESDLQQATGKRIDYDEIYKKLFSKYRELITFIESLGYNTLDVDYPKDFGSGYKLEDFPSDCKIIGGQFIYKKEELLRKETEEQK